MSGDHMEHTNQATSDTLKCTQLFKRCSQNVISTKYIMWSKIIYKRKLKQEKRNRDGKNGKIEKKRRKSKCNRNNSHYIVIIIMWFPEQYSFFSIRCTQMLLIITAKTQEEKC